MALSIGNQKNVPSGGGNVLGGNVVPAQGIYEESLTAKHPIGARMQLGERVFYYAKASEALSAGKLATSSATTITEDTVTVAHPAGTTAVTITASATITKDQFAGGYLIVDEGTGVGESYRIKGNDAITSGSTGTVTLEDGLLTAWSTSDTDVTLYVSPLYVQEANVDQKERAAGVPLTSIQANYYFWLQTYGPAPVLFDEVVGDLAAERMVTIGSSTAGSVEAVDAIGEEIVGHVIIDAADNADGTYGLVDLTIRS